MDICASTPAQSVSSSLKYLPIHPKQMHVNVQNYPSLMADVQLEEYMGDSVFLLQSETSAKDSVYTIIMCLLFGVLCFLPCLELHK